MWRLFNNLIIISLIALIKGELYNINVIHINDFHARYEETSIHEGPCKSSNCIGGFSRLYTKINSLLKENPKNDSILLNAGDNFQGTLYYNLFKWNITQYFLNMLPFDAVTLGNHEFDDGVQGVVPFIEALKAPVVVSNINDTLEPTLQGLYTKSIVIERSGKKIGIIGVLTANTKNLQNVGNLTFLDESESINQEAERLVREEKVFTNIVLSHSGYDLEKEMARKAKGKISLIVGGHTHTFLSSNKTSEGPDKPKGPYPTIIKRDLDGEKVLVVQASSNTKYLGKIQIFYNENGNVVNFAGAPIFLDHTIPQDERINELLKPFKGEVDKIANEVLGKSLVLLHSGNCTFSECNFGNLVTDLYIQNYTTDTGSSWTSAAIGITNPSTMRTSIERGDITYNDLLLSLPFKDTIDAGDIEGKYIKELFEQSWQNENLLQVSGLHIVIDPSQVKGNQVRSIKVRCRQCNVPIYEDLDLNKLYRIILPSYLRKGGDGYIILKDNLKNITVGHINWDIYRNAFKTKSPLYAEIEERIKIIGNP